MLYGSTTLAASHSPPRLEVLLVEPKDLVAARLKTQLEQLGHRVLGLARDGREGVAAAQRLHPGLVVVESKLPTLDGIDAARAIVTNRLVPVILRTDYVGAELVRRGQEAGVLAYLTSLERKPLLSAIDVALARFEDLRFFHREGSDVGEALETWRLVDRTKKILTTRLASSEARALLHLFERAQSTRRSLREAAWTIIQADEAVSALDRARALQVIVDSLGGPRHVGPKPLPSRAAPATALRRDSPKGANPTL